MSKEAPWPVFAIRHYDICNDAAHKGNIRIIKEFFDSKNEVSVWAALFQVQSTCCKAAKSCKHETLSFFIVL